MEKGEAMEKPAILGGTPVRQKHIYYGQQWIEEDDINAVANTLRGRLVTCGPKVEALEKQLAQLVGAKHVCVCSNGTADVTKKLPNTQKQSSPWISSIIPSFRQTTLYMQGIF